MIAACSSFISSKLTLIFEMGNGLKGECTQEFWCLTVVVSLEEDPLDASYIPDPGISEFHYSAIPYDKIKFKNHSYPHWHVKCFSSPQFRKIEFPPPNEEARLDILKIHSRKMNLTRSVKTISFFY